MTTIRGVFFDVDDTLFDRELAQRRVLRSIVERYPDAFEGTTEESAFSAFHESDRISNDEYEAGFPASKLRIRRAELFLGVLGLDLSIAGEISDLYVNEYPTLDVPVAGARELVASLGSRLTLGVISTTT